jgi:hypothetical protein
MAAPTTIASAEGSLYELVARGKKDTYFFQDSTDSLNIFDSSYKPQTPWLSEVRRIPPRTSAEFGRTVDFDIDLIGDVLTSPTFVIDLPTWLPSNIAAQAARSVTTDTAGVSYGYTNGAAFFLFESIQIYQDTLLLQEFSGDSLWALTKLQGTYAHRFISNDLTATHDGTPLSISRNAVPPQLRLSIPFIGCQKPTDPGFPHRAVTSQTYRIKAKLRRLEDLIESSDSRAKPTPWGRTDFQQTAQKGTAPVPFTTLSRTAIPPIRLQLETIQIYTSQPIQELLKSQRHTIPFTRIFESVFTQGPLDYQGVNNSGTSFVSRRIDGRHPSGRILFFFRSSTDLLANRLWKIDSNGSSYYNSVSLLIAGRTREDQQSALIWRDITCHAKEDIDSALQLSSMNWTLGDAVGRRPYDAKQPDGSVNFTTADRPTFYIDLAVPNAPFTELRVIVEGWAMYQTDGKGRGEMFQLN